MCRDARWLPLAWGVMPDGGSVNRQISTYRLGVALRPDGSVRGRIAFGDAGVSDLAPEDTADLALWGTCASIRRRCIVGLGVAIVMADAAGVASPAAGALQVTADGWVYHGGYPGVGPWSGGFPPRPSEMVGDVAPHTWVSVRSTLNRSGTVDAGAISRQRFAPACMPVAMDLRGQMATVGDRRAMWVLLGAFGVRNEQQEGEK